MSIKEKWERVDIDQFAAAWLEEERAGGSNADDSLAMKATLMSFTASSEVQWKFILAAVNGAKDRDELWTIAAGPFESLMGKSGGEYIDQLEALSANDAKIVQMTRGAWQHTMSDEVWVRVQSIQKMPAAFDK